MGRCQGRLEGVNSTPVYNQAVNAIKNNSNNNRFLIIEIVQEKFSTSPQTVF